MKNRFRGCLIGGAIGDALGYTVEFFTLDRIKNIYGEGGIRRLPCPQGPALISDDTQMTLFTAEGLIKARDRGVGHKRSIYLSYLDWFKTQEQYFTAGGEGLLAIAELFERRAPGTTCLGSLRSGLEGGVSFPINSSKGCGGVMRTAPIALYCYAKGANILGANELAAEAAAITHGHVLGHLPSYALNHLLYKILEGEDILCAASLAVEETQKRYSVYSEAEEGLSLMKKAISLASDYDLSDEDAIRSLGEGWVADEALAIAMYCALRHKDSFEDAVIAAVNHDGDSDSTGAITGNILGAYLGADAIPEHYLNLVELRDVILNMADSLI